MLLRCEENYYDNLSTAESEEELIEDLPVSRF